MTTNRQAETPFARTLRERGVRQKDIAERLEVSPSEVSRWTKGLVPPQEARAQLTRILKTRDRALFPHAYAASEGSKEVPTNE